MSDSAQPAPREGLITEEMTRRNGAIFLLSFLLIYFAAPAIYIGIVQAALVDKLGASATMANLPLSMYKFGSFAPLMKTLNHLLAGPGRQPVAACHHPCQVAPRGPEATRVGVGNTTKKQRLRLIYVQRRMTEVLRRCRPHDAKEGGA